MKALLLCASIGLACAQTPEFEAASIKVAGPMDRGNCRGAPGSNSPGQYSCVGGSLRLYVARAWDLSPHELAGPTSMDDAKFIIVAKVPPNTSKEGFNLMLQNLLVQRIELKTHRENREQTVYDMVVAKSGLKLRVAEPKPDGPNDPVATPHLIRDKNGNQVLPPGVPALMNGGLPGGLIRWMARMQGMDKITSFVERSIGHKVTDKTGLTGKYDYVLDYAPATVAVDAGPSFAEAVTEQLGLKLEAKKGMVDVLVVDSFNKLPADR